MSEQQALRRQLAHLPGVLFLTLSEARWLVRLIHKGETPPLLSPPLEAKRS